MDLLAHNGNGELASEDSARQLFGLMPHMTAPNDKSLAVLVLTNTQEKSPALLAAARARSDERTGDDLLKVLQGWIKTAGEDRGQAPLLVDFLKLADALPVTFEAVLKSEVGKAVSKLSSSHPKSTHWDPGAHVGRC